MCFGALPSRSGQFLLHQFVVAADSTGGDHDGLCGELEFADGGARTLHAAQITGRFEDGSAYTSDRTIGDDELIDLVAVLERDQSALLGSNHLGQKDIDHAGAGSPGEVEARHRIAVSKSHSAAAFGPADIRHQGEAPDRAGTDACRPLRTRRTPWPTDRGQ